MFKSVFLIIFSIFTLHKGAVGSSEDKFCSGDSSRSGTLNLSIQSQRNQSGEWVTVFSASRDSEDSENIIKLDVNHTVVECDGKKIVQVHGILRDTPAHPAIPRCNEEEFLFHPNVGKSITLTNNRKTAIRNNPTSVELQGSAITHRLLKRDELFEVQIEKNISKYDNNIVIGVTTHFPDNIVHNQWMNDLKSGTWLMYDKQVRKNGSAVRSTYGRDLRTLQAGDRVGIIVKKDNALHLILNGIDQGIAAENIPSSVYAFIDVMGNTFQATIIDKCSSLH